MTAEISRTRYPTRQALQFSTSVLERGCTTLVVTVESTQLTQGHMIYLCDHALHGKDLC